MVNIHPHALERAGERGTTEQEIIQAVLKGEMFPAKYQHTGFRINLNFGEEWNGIYYQTKQLEVYAVKEGNNWLVITVIVKYF